MFDFDSPLSCYLRQQYTKWMIMITKLFSIFCIDKYHGICCTQWVAHRSWATGHVQVTSWAVKWDVTTVSRLSINYRCRSEAMCDVWRGSTLKTCRVVGRIWHFDQVWHNRRLVSGHTASEVLVVSWQTCCSHHQWNRRPPRLIRLELSWLILLWDWWQPLQHGRPDDQTSHHGRLLPPPWPPTSCMHHCSTHSSTSWTEQPCWCTNTTATSHIYHQRRHRGHRLTPLSLDKPTLEALRCLSTSHHSHILITSYRRRVQQLPRRSSPTHSR